MKKTKQEEQHEKGTVSIKTKNIALVVSVNCRSIIATINFYH